MFIAFCGNMEEASQSYYSVLGQWHPDKWTKTPSLLSEAKRKFQKIQEAYSVLSDQKKRRMYDVGLYEPDEEEEDKGFYGFVQELVCLIAQDRREGRSYTMEDLQCMFTEMVQGFEQSPWYSGPAIYDDLNRS